MNQWLLGMIECLYLGIACLNTMVDGATVCMWGGGGERRQLLCMPCLSTSQKQVVGRCMKLAY